jgi:hypothetical protein
MELHPGEMHGCAVVRAYELESQVAQYPRIVLGPYFMQYLVLRSRQQPIDIYTALNRSTAEICQELISLDDDKKHFVDYLGKGFEKYISKGQVEELKSHALDFVRESLDTWKSKGDEKLIQRYNRLLAYFERSK